MSRIARWGQTLAAGGRASTGGTGLPSHAIQLPTHSAIRSARRCRMNPAVFSSFAELMRAPLATTGSQGPDRITKTVERCGRPGDQECKKRPDGITTANGFPITLQQDYQTY